MTVKSAQTIDRLVELWPHLPEAVRTELITRAETIAANTDSVPFTAEELAGIEQGREDFKHDRTLSVEQFESNMDAFMNELRQKAARAS
jgi:hypothetical protein